MGKSFKQRFFGRGNAAKNFITGKGWLSRLVPMNPGVLYRIGKNTVNGIRRHKAGSNIAKLYGGSRSNNSAMGVYANGSSIYGQSGSIVGKV